MRYLLMYISLMLLGAHVQAQSFQGSVSGNAMVYSIMSLDINQLGGNIAFSNANDYFNGVTVNKYATMTVKANENWVLSFESNSQFFTPLSKYSSDKMPCSVLSIKETNSRSFKKLKPKSSKLVQGGRGTNTYDIDVNLNPGFGYSGGLYSVGVIYTLTKQ